MRTKEAREIERDVDHVIQEVEEYTKIKGTPAGMWDLVSSLEQEGCYFRDVLLMLAAHGYLDVLRSEGQRLQAELPECKAVVLEGDELTAFLEEAFGPMCGQGNKSLTLDGAFDPVLEG